MFRRSNYNILLNNGEIAPETAVSQVMTALFQLKSSQTEIYDEFVNKCNDPNHKLPDHANEILTRLNLVKSGLVTELTKNIYLSAAQDRDFSPVHRMIPTSKI